MSDRTAGSIVIDAAPPAVMDEIANLGSYREWAGVAGARVITRRPDGRPHRAEMSVDAGIFSDDFEIEYDWHGSESVDWHLVKGGLLTTNNGTYRLRATDAGTEVEYQLEIELTIPTIGLFRRRAEKVIVDKALRGLKRHVEAAAGLAAPADPAASTAEDSDGDSDRDSDGDSDRDDGLA